LGFVVTPGAEPSLRVDIREWNLDSYQNGRFGCELDVSVRSRDGSELARDRVSYEHYLKGSFWTGGKAGAEREMPTAYGKVIDQVLTANATIRAALAPPH
jgi:hypothetical protein